MSKTIDRTAQLKLMNDLITQANDEDIYMEWIQTMPDQATEDDFLDIAEDDESYNDCFDAFVRLIALEGNRY